MGVYRSVRGAGFGDWKLAQEKPFYAETLAALQELGASFVRYQGWHNRPDLTVAANDAGDSRQVWDFSKIDPPLLDFLAANGGRPFILYVSYHFYALYKASEMHSNLAITVFDQADEFIESLRYVCAIRDVLSPRTGLMITEIGTMNQGTRARPTDLLRLEIQLSAAMYAYLYSRLAALGVKAVHISGLVAVQPDQMWQELAMIEWTSGRPNARYWVLKLLNEHFPTGSTLVQTRNFTAPPYPLPPVALERMSRAAPVFGQAFVTPQGARKLLLIKRTNEPVAVNLGIEVAASWRFVDYGEGNGEPQTSDHRGNSFTMGPLVIAIANFDEV